ncbi:MAG: ATP-binding protein [Bacteroidaceae bacterium]|nr:ATP-binding protein [Bacteroidaceae bacterium]
MLVFFRICNFKSIVETTVDMRYGEGKAPNGYKEMEHYPFLEYQAENGQVLRLSPVLAIYGQNAGGKTTLVEAMNTLRRCLFENKLHYRPNKLHPDLKDSTFEICFASEGVVYTYTLCYNLSGVKRETLRTYDTDVFEIDHEQALYNFEQLATELYTTERLMAVLKTECCNSKGEQIVSYLGKIATNYPGLNAKLSNAYQFLIYGISNSLENDFSAPFAINYLAQGEQDSTHEQAFQEIAKYLRRLDIDIASMELILREEKFSSKPDDDGGREPELMYRINSYHKDKNGELVALDFREESRGTQVLFGLLGVVLRKLRTGGVLVIDEIDRSLHSLLLVALVSLFTNKEYNVKGAQLILTAHNTELLGADNLRTSQVAIVTKTSQQGTLVRRLCDFDGVRNVQNFRKTYLEGAFSGIPFPII